MESIENQYISFVSLCSWTWWLLKICKKNLKPDIYCIRYEIKFHVPQLAFQDVFQNLWVHTWWVTHKFSFWPEADCQPAFYSSLTSQPARVLPANRKLFKFFQNFLQIHSFRVLYWFCIGKNQSLYTSRVSECYE